MSRWTPNPSAIENAEHLGRRLSKGDLIKDADKNSRESLKYTAFFEERPTTNISLDRLGLGVPNKQVIQWLTPMADEWAEMREKIFSGWAAMPHSKIALARKILPQPTSENEYHAEVDCGAYTNRDAMKNLAFALFFHFLKYGQIVPKAER